MNILPFHGAAVKVSESGLHIISSSSACCMPDLPSFFLLPFFNSRILPILPHHMPITSRQGHSMSVHHRLYHSGSCCCSPGCLPGFSTINTMGFVFVSSSFSLCLLWKGVTVNTVRVPAAGSGKWSIRIFSWDFCTRDLPAIPHLFMHHLLILLGISRNVIYPLCYNPTPLAFVAQLVPG